MAYVVIQTEQEGKENRELHCAQKRSSAKDLPLSHGAAPPRCTLFRKFFSLMGEAGFFWSLVAYETAI